MFKPTLLVLFLAGSPAVDVAGSPTLAPDHPEVVARQYQDVFTGGAALGLLTKLEGDSREAMLDAIREAYDFVSLELFPPQLVRRPFDAVCDEFAAGVPALELAKILAERAEQLSAQRGAKALEFFEALVADLPATTQDAIAEVMAKSRHNYAIHRSGGAWTSFVEQDPEMFMFQVERACRPES